MKETRKSARMAYGELIARVGYENITCGDERAIMLSIGCSATEAQNALSYWKYRKNGNWHE